MDPYKVRFSFFWYNDEELFHDTQEDLDRKMKAFADQGITHVMTFSCTHFRWSFRPWWGVINECLRKVVNAAHKYGIKVIEHHSAELVFRPEAPEFRDMMEKRLKKRHSGFSSWPRIVEYLCDKNCPSNTDIQIDLFTEKPLVNNYGAYSKCYSNPKYLKEYKEYLESVYATGVDGIMTDDIQFHGYCACEHCKKIFKEKYGYDFPPMEERKAWVGNYADPSFAAYQEMRFNITHHFHEEIAAHYHSLGLQPLRPNYISQALCRDWTASGVETVPELDWFFQEVAYGCIIRYTWPKVLAEQSHRAMIARKRGIPHGALFYSFTHDQLVFSWGLSMLAGAFYINTPEGSLEPVDETEIRNFEKLYGDELFHADLLSTVGFLDNRTNRYLTAAYEVNRMQFLMNLCSVNNIPFRMVDAMIPESWKKCRILFLNEVNILSEKEIRDLLDYVSIGGCILISGIPGNQDENRKTRSLEDCEKLWGIPLKAPEKTPAVFAHGKGKLCVIPLSFAFPDADDAEKAFGRNHMEIKSTEIPYPLLHNYNFITDGICSKDPEKPQSLYNGIRHSSAEMIALLRELIGEASFADLPEGLLAAPFKSDAKNCYSIRLLNAADTMEKENGEYTPAFSYPVPWKKLSGKGTFRMPVSEVPEKGFSAFLTDLRGMKKELSCEISAGKLIVSLDCEQIRDFGFIQIRERK